MQSARWNFDQIGGCNDVIGLFHFAILVNIDDVQLIRTFQRLSANSFGSQNGPNRLWRIPRDVKPQRVKLWRLRKGHLFVSDGFILSPTKTLLESERSPIIFRKGVGTFFISVGIANIWPASASWGSVKKSSTCSSGNLSDALHKEFLSFLAPHPSGPFFRRCRVLDATFLLMNFIFWFGWCFFLAWQSCS